MFRFGVGQNVGAGSWNGAYFPQSGPVSLPSWLTYIRASVCTAILDDGTMLRGVVAHQPVANAWGLQVEPATTNSNPYGDDITAWTATFATVTPGQVDVAGGTMAAIVVGGAGGALKESYLTSTVLTASCYVKGHPGGTDIALVGASDSGVTPITGSSELHPSATWHRLCSTYSGTSKSSTYFLVSDKRCPVSVPVGDAIYCAPQLESLSACSSYVATNGATANRATVILRATMPDRLRPVLDVTFVANRPPTTSAAPGDVVTVLAMSADTNTWFGWEHASGNFRLLNGTTYVGTTPLAWADGDLVRIKVTTAITAKTIRCQVWVNGASTVDNTITMAQSFSFSSATPTIFSSTAGGLHVFPKGVRNISIGIGAA